MGAADSSSALRCISISAHAGHVLLWLKARSAIPAVHRPVHCARRGAGGSLRRRFRWQLRRSALMSLEQSALCVGLHQALRPFLNVGGGAGRELLLFCKIGRQGRIAAFGNGRGAAYGRVDQAVPVADEAFLGQRFVRSRRWVDTEAVCNCHTPNKVPSSDRANSKPKGQRRFPMGDLIHEED